MVPHVHVHRRSHNDRRCRGKVQRGQKVSGHSLREVGKNISSSWGYHERIDRLRDRDVFDGRVDVGFMRFVRREHAGDDFLSGKRGKGEGSNELLGGPRHHDLHADAVILQEADDLCRLVGCNAAGDAEGDLHDEISDFRLSISDLTLVRQIDNRKSTIDNRPSPAPGPYRALRWPARRRCASPGPPI